jgi:hypothetical protein
MPNNSLSFASIVTSLSSRPLIPLCVYFLPPLCTPCLLRL